MKHFTLYSFLLTVWVAVALFSCQEPEPPTPEPQPEEGIAKNTYIINGTEHSFGSAAVMMVGENPLIIATPEVGIVSAEEMLACEEYFYGAVSPLLLGEEFDIATEQRLYTFVSTLAGASLETVAPEFLEEVSEGRCTIEKSGNIFTLKAEMKLTDGSTLAVHIEAEDSFVVNENRISRNNEEKPLRAAFYKRAKGTTELYFTPAGVDYFEELEVASWYLYVGVADKYINGEVVSITNLSGGKFRFGVVDNITGENIDISESDMQGATGTLRLSLTDDATYTADVTIELDGTTYKVTYHGDCTSWELAPEERLNYLTYGKGANQKEIDLVSASVDSSTDVWIVELTAADKSVLSATVPVDFFTGEAKGFSQSPNLTVTYNGRTYSKANGDSGTIIASYFILDCPDEAPRLYFEFIGYDDLSCIYSGEVH